MPKPTDKPPKPGKPPEPVEPPIEEIPESMTFTATGNMEQEADGGFTMYLEMEIVPPNMTNMAFQGAGTMEPKADGGFLMTLDVV